MIPGLAWLLAGGWRYLFGAAAVIGVIASHAYAWKHGHDAATAKCREAALRAELAAVRRDLESFKTAADDATRRAVAAEAQHQRNEELIRDYETRLGRTAKPARACVLDGADERRLRAIRPR